MIPLENLVAQSDHIIARVKNVTETEMAIHVLEKGVYGILLSTTDPAVVKAVAAILKSTTGKVGLVPFRVTKIQPVGMGDRVCVGRNAFQRKDTKAFVQALCNVVHHNVDPAKALEQHK